MHWNGTAISASLCRNCATVRKAWTDKLDRGKGMVSLPELRKGRVGLVVATQIARYADHHSTLPGWHSPEQAWAQTQGQLAWYKAMEAADEMIQIRNLAALESHLENWTNNEYTR